MRSQKVVELLSVRGVPEPDTGPGEEAEGHEAEVIVVHGGEAGPGELRHDGPRLVPLSGVGQSRSQRDPVHHSRGNLLEYGGPQLGGLVTTALESPEQPQGDPEANRHAHEGLEDQPVRLKQR